MVDPKKLEEEIKNEIFTPGSLNEVTDADDEDTIILKVERAARKIIREKYLSEIDPLILAKLEEDIKQREEELIRRREAGEERTELPEHESIEEMKKRIEEKLSWTKTVRPVSEKGDVREELRNALTAAGYEADEETVHAWYEVGKHFVDDESQIPEVVVKIVDVIARGGGSLSLALSPEKKEALRTYLKENYGVPIEVT